MADPVLERAFMTRWLTEMLAPGDQIVADIRASAGPSLHWDWLTMPAIVVTTVGGWREVTGPAQSHAMQGLLALAGVGNAVVSLSLAKTRKKVYVAVTDRHVVAVEMRGRCRPVRVLFRVPISASLLTTGHSFPLRAITFATTDGNPICYGAKDRARVRLTLHTRRRRLDDLLSAFRAQGGSVDLPPLPTAAALSGPA